jgi:hypothetical protein
MSAEIKKARESVRRISTGENSESKYFKIVLYEDHCDSELIR